MITASALHKGDASRSTGSTRVKPDQWDPQVSVTGAATEANLWTQVNADCAKTKLTRGAAGLALI
jgi:hypothetical protein